MLQLLRHPHTSSRLYRYLSTHRTGSQCFYWSSNLQHPLQSYISASNSPYVNLSLEHHLLQHTAPNSTVLLFYTNSPSLILGRNQNPWIELNLTEALGTGRTSGSGVDGAATATVSHDVTRRDQMEIVRRRSGGGTVFHDLGNINWSVISPPSSFTRDKHAEMVVRALRSPLCNVARARVNERHDIVLDQGVERTQRETDSGDMHVTPWTGDGARALKVSGSAYKLTKHRALHHGTCLLHSPNLHNIGHYLHSPARLYIRAKGVESVSSPVGNVGITHDAFVTAVRRDFRRMYCPRGEGVAHVEVGEEEALEEESVRKGVEELKSKEWTYGQTPQFVFEIGPGEVRSLGLGLPETLRLRMSVVKGTIVEFWLSTHSDSEGKEARRQAEEVARVTGLMGENLMGGWTWMEKLGRARQALGLEVKEMESLCNFLGRVLPVIGRE